MTEYKKMSVEQYLNGHGRPLDKKTFGDSDSTLIATINQFESFIFVFSLVIPGYMC